VCRGGRKLLASTVLRIQHEQRAGLVHPRRQGHPPVVLLCDLWVDSSRVRIKFYFSKEQIKTRKKTNKNWLSKPCSSDTILITANESKLSTPRNASRKKRLHSALVKLQLQVLVEFVVRLQPVRPDAKRSAGGNHRPEGGQKRQELP